MEVAGTSHNASKTIIDKKLVTTSVVVVTNLPAMKNMKRIIENQWRNINHPPYLIASAAAPELPLSSIIIKI